MHYNWKRYWVKRGESFSIDGWGYLRDPEDEQWLRPSLYSFPEIAKATCLILLGEPGIGKSTILEEHAKDPDAEHHLYLNLRGYGDQNLLNSDLFSSDTFKKWCNTEGQLVLTLDSFDECLIHIKPLATFIADKLGKCPIDRLRLRIACRTAEWPPFLESELKAIWPANDAVQVYEMVPLRRKDIASAAIASSLNAETFLKEVEERGVVAFAITPVTLRFLLAEFQSSGKLPTSTHELYERGLLRLAAEHEASSRKASGTAGKVAPRERVTVAERVAAALLFGRKGSVVVAPHETVGRDELDPVELQGVDVINGSAVSVTAEMLDETLKCSLFNGRSAGRVGFSHQSFGEFLAARYCVTRQLSLRQIGEIIFHPDSGEQPKVVPQLAEVAAWLAVMLPDVLREIAQADPKTLLKRRVTSMTAAQRHEVTEAILRKSDEITFTDSDETFRRPEYEVLSHSGLADQLRPYALDRTKHIMSRRVAISIAEKCRVLDLLPSLQTIALDTKDVYDIRGLAAHAVLRIGDQAAKAALRPLIDVTREEDQFDQLKGYGLRGLWPHGLSPAELFSKLSPQSREHFSGSYAMFVGFDLPELLRPSDLPDALDWVQGMSTSLRAWHDAARLRSSIINLALSQMDSPTVVSKLTDIALAELHEFRGLLDGKLGDDEHVTVTDKARLELVRQMVDRMGEEDENSLFRLFHCNYLSVNDFKWLFGELRCTTGTPSARAWAALTCAARSEDRPDDLCDLLAARSELPELANRLGNSFDPVDLQSERAAQGRLRWRERQKIARPETNKLATHPPVSTLVRECLDRFDAGDNGAWWQMHLQLTLTPDSDDYREYRMGDASLTTFEGWGELDATLQERICCTAPLYLARVQPDASWIGTDVLDYAASAGVRALSLLLEKDIASLDALPHDLWVRWAPTIIGMPTSTISEREVPRQELARRAYLNARSVVLDTVDRLLDSQCSERSYITCLSQFETFWDSGLSDLVFRRLRGQSPLPLHAVHVLLDTMLPHVGAEGQVVAMEIVNRRDRSEVDWKVAVAASVELLTNVPAAAWPELWPIMRSEPKFGMAVLSALAGHHEELHTGRLATMLGEKDVGELYIWLRLKSRLENDYDDDDSDVVGPMDRVANFRDGLIRSLVERGTKQAVESLRWAASQLPSGEWLRYSALIAERNRLQMHWDGLPIPVIVAMARQRSAHPLENEEQLVNAVLDALQLLEQQLHGETPAIPDLWDGKRPKDENAFSDYIKRHLERELRPLGAIANREAEVRRGQETDIRIEMLRCDPATGSLSKLMVIIEVKGCWHREVKTAMKTQLADRYLRHPPIGAGVYLVGWFCCDDWDPNDSRRAKTPAMTLPDARNMFSEQAKDISASGTYVRGFVLDTGLRRP